MAGKVFKTTEGRVLITGFILTGLLLLVIFFFIMTDTETAEVLSLVFLAHTFGGRAAGIGLCIMNEFGAFSTIAYNFYLEVLIVCYTYSVFVLTTKNYIKVHWLSRLMEKLAGKAASQKEKIMVYGWIGLFIFVMLPLPVTGPVVGVVIGYMLNLRLTRNFSAAGAGTLTAIIIWFFCFDYLEDRFHAIQYIFAAIVLALVLSYYKSIYNFFSALKSGSRD